MVDQKQIQHEDDQKRMSSASGNRGKHTKSLGLSVEKGTLNLSPPANK